MHGKPLVQPLIPFDLRVTLTLTLAALGLALTLHLRLEGLLASFSCRSPHTFYHLIDHTHGQAERRRCRWGLYRNGGKGCKTGVHKPVKHRVRRFAHFLGAGTAPLTSHLMTSTHV
ncbi:hypothetical protein EV426DRAFT_293142 [Tirmania nivea]|nr:hypothetical protein EV426DRAFT_293142 [Tirmania nivea]